MKNKLLNTTIIVTALYCFICFASAWCIIYGAYGNKPTMFEIGNTLIYLWLFNPIVIILSVISAVKKKMKTRYAVLCSVGAVVSWLTASSIIASFF